MKDKLASYNHLIETFVIVTETFLCGLLFLLFSKLSKHLDKEKLNEYLVWQLREYNGKYGLTKNNDAEVNVSWQT